MHDMYFDWQGRVFIPRSKLAELGLPEDEAELILYAYYPVKFVIPERRDPQADAMKTPTYDPAIQGLEPDGEPEFSEDEPDLLIQKMRIVNFLEQFRAGKKRELAAKRWEMQCAGLTLADGTVIQTNPDDFGRLCATAQSAGEQVTLKAASGWAIVSKERLNEIIRLAGAYIDACYAWERRLAGAIEIAGSIELLNSIDINQGWPAATEQAE